MPVPYNGSVARLSFGFRSASRVRRWVRDGDFDVLHVHEPAAPSLSLLACWVATGPIVATFHTANPRSRVMHAAEPMLQSALEKISARIAVSEAARTDAGRAPRRRCGPHPERGRGPPVREGRSAARLARRRAGPSASSAGCDEPRKGLAGAAAGVRAHGPQRPGLRLLIAGPGDADEARDRVGAELRDRVVLLGRVSEEDKVRALHSVDVFCAPNTGGESFGIVLAEAMAAGAPIVASDIEAFRRVLRGGQAGELFAAGDPAELARAAGLLLDDPERRASLSDAASEAVRGYDWPVVARDVVQVYETVVSGGGQVRVAAVAARGGR